MDYEKRYKEAIERAKKWQKDGYGKGCQEVVEDIFPELAESEDERIRLGLINAFEEFLRQNDYDEETNFKGVNTKDAIAWLEKQGEPKKHNICDSCDQQGSCVNPCCVKLVEKQGEQKPVIEMKSAEESLGIDSETYNKIVDECIYGEQKPANKVEPKFKVGDKIKLKREPKYPFREIVDIRNNAYYFDKAVYLPFEKQDEWEVKKKSAEWSDEDEQHIASLLKRLDGLCRNEFERTRFAISEDEDWLKSLEDRYAWKPSDAHYELEEFAKIVRGNLTGISKDVQKLFEAKYLQLTGNKMYGGFKD